MIHRPRRFSCAFLLALLFSALGAHAQEQKLPPVRAVTAFVNVTPENYARRIDDALQILRTAKSDFEKSGYQVQTLRIVTQPLSDLVKGRSDAQVLAFLTAFDALAVKERFMPSVGTAMMSDTDDPRAIRLLGRALSTLPHLQATANIAGADGIQWKVVREAAVLVRYLADHSPGSRGTFNFTAAAMIEPYTPFFPGAYHAGEGGRFSFGFESANVVRDVFARTRGDINGAEAELTRQLTVHAKLAEMIGLRVASATGWSFAGVDPTPAPGSDASIGEAMERYTGASFGSSGTLTAAAIITRAVKAVPVKQIGYSGLMLPVLEDSVLAERWAKHAITTDTLLAYSAVCGTGLDTIPLPGEITVEQLERILGDVAALAWKWKKPLSARLQPVKGLEAGQRTRFNDGFFDTVLYELQ